jgi:hypothetical protein
MEIHNSWPCTTNAYTSEAKKGRSRIERGAERERGGEGRSMNFKKKAGKFLRGGERDTG